MLDVKFVRENIPAVEEARFEVALEPFREATGTIIGASVRAMLEDRARALAVGFQVHVPKPVEPAELVEVVARLAGR